MADCSVIHKADGIEGRMTKILCEILWMYKTDKMTETKERKMYTFVMDSKDSEDYTISRDYADVEIRDGFNDKLVVQYYEKTRRILLYIPHKWEKKIKIVIRKGTIQCCQEKVYENLKMQVKNGTIQTISKAKDRDGNIY